MSSFLEKLERLTERWMHIMDGQLNDPVVRTLTGTVLTHDPSMNVAGYQEETVLHDAEIATMPLPPTRAAYKAAPELYSPVLKKAPASSK